MARPTVPSLSPARLNERDPAAGSNGCGDWNYKRWRRGDVFNRLDADAFNRRNLKGLGDRQARIRSAAIEAHRHRQELWSDAPPTARRQPARRARDHHGIVGENEASKSTLMSILYRFYEADAGEIRINGAPVRDPFFLRSAGDPATASAWCISTSCWCRRSPSMENVHAQRRRGRPPRPRAPTPCAQSWPSWSANTKPPGRSRRDRRRTPRSACSSAWKS